MGLSAEDQVFDDQTYYPRCVMPPGHCSLSVDWGAPKTKAQVQCDLGDFVTLKLLLLFGQFQFDLAAATVATGVVVLSEKEHLRKGFEPSEVVEVFELIGAKQVPKSRGGDSSRRSWRATYWETSTS